VLWTRKSGVQLRSLAELQSPDIQHIAIANPEHAPYGKAARQAITRAGLWPALEAKIVQAENVRQALQFAQTGNADAAIIALSLVAKDDTGVRLALDPASYDPIEQTLVVCRHGKNAIGARAFAELVESRAGQALLERYGFGSASEPSRK
jgi:molybdate transport system substrate-binding protein